MTKQKTSYIQLAIMVLVWTFDLWCLLAIIQLINLASKAVLR